jgi:hypothetical protein
MARRNPWPPEEDLPPEDRFGCILILICLALFWLIVLAVLLDWTLPDVLG